MLIFSSCNKEDDTHEPDPISESTPVPIATETCLLDLEGSSLKIPQLNTSTILFN